MEWNWKCLRCGSDITPENPTHPAAPGYFGCQGCLAGGDAEKVQQWVLVMKSSIRCVGDEQA